MDIVKKIKNYTYNQRHCLGQGSFGRVYQGRSDQGLKVAIKRIQQSMVSKDAYLRSSLQTQINIMKKLNHSNIVKLYDVVITSNSIYLIMEFCAGGDLKRYCRNRKLSEDEATNIIKQISKGFQQIVQLNIIHRDLKPANILVHEGVFKICDFGFAKFFNDTSRMARTCVGTPIYMSPQVLSQKSYTDKTDVWSLGILYYQLLFAKLPYYGTTEDALFKNITRGTLTLPNCSNFTANLLRGMLQIEQNKRYSWAKVFQTFNFAPLEQNRLDGIAIVKKGSEKQIQPNQNNNMNFYKPIEVKKQPSQNNYVNEQYEPQNLNNFKDSYAQKYNQIQIYEQDGRRQAPQRKPKNPLAFQTPVNNLAQQINPNQQVNQFQNINMNMNMNMNNNINQYVAPQYLNGQSPLNPIVQPQQSFNSVPSLPPLPSSYPPTSSVQNPRFLYFVLIQLIVDPIKNSGSYPQLVSALYKRTVQLYIKSVQKQKNSLYGKVLASQFQQIKSLQSQIPNFVNDNLQKSAETVIRQYGQNMMNNNTKGNANMNMSNSNSNSNSNSIVWVYKLLNKSYTYQK